MFRLIETKFNGTGAANRVAMVVIPRSLKTRGVIFGAGMT